MLNELYIAEKGRGAFLNGKKLSCSDTKNLANSFIAFGFPYDICDNDPYHLFEQIKALGKIGTPMRRMGSAAIDIAYVAAGRFDGFWETFLNPWDYAAGKLLLDEAGGKFTNLKGEPYTTLTEGDIVVSNTHIHEAFISRLNLL